VVLPKGNPETINKDLFSNKKIIYSK